MARFGVAIIPTDDALQPVELARTFELPRE